jgi:hypothetical protein
MQNKNSRTVLLVVLSISLVFNLAIVFFMIFNTSSFLSYKKIDNYFSGAQLVSVPKGRRVEFGTVTVSLQEGDVAYLQYSAMLEGDQLNYSNRYLYDGNIIRVEDDAFGVKITAVKEGEALLQVFSNDGFSNVANIIVGLNAKE